MNQRRPFVSRIPVSSLARSNQVAMRIQRGTHMHHYACFYGIHRKLAAAVFLFRLLRPFHIWLKES